MLSRCHSLFLGMVPVPVLLLVAGAGAGAPRSGADVPLVGSAELQSEVEEEKEVWRAVAIDWKEYIPFPY